MGDDRYAPSKTLWKALVESGAQALVVDPFVTGWPGLPEAKIYPSLPTALPGADVLVFAKCHQEYLGLDPNKVVKMTGKKPLIVDCSNYLSDNEITKYLKLGCQVKGVGKGHIPQLNR